MIELLSLAVVPHQKFQKAADRRNYQTLQAFDDPNAIN